MPSSSLDSVPSTIPGSCRSSNAWNSVNRLVLFKPLQLIINPVSLFFRVMFDGFGYDLRPRLGDEVTGIDELVVVVVVVVRSTCRLSNMEKEFDKSTSEIELSAELKKLDDPHSGQIHAQDEFARFS